MEDKLFEIAKIAVPVLLAIGTGIIGAAWALLKYFGHKYLSAIETRLDKLDENHKDIMKQIMSVNKTYTTSETCALVNKNYDLKLATIEGRIIKLEDRVDSLEEE